MRRIGYCRTLPRRSQAGSIMAEYLVRAPARYRLVDAFLVKTRDRRIVSYLLYLDDRSNHKIQRVTVYVPDERWHVNNPG